VRRCVSLWLGLAAWLACGAALAQSSPARADDPSREGPTSPTRAASYQALAAAPRGYVRLQGSLALGGGLRFNNPYRLRSILGATAESVSLTAPYLDLGLGFLLGPPDRLQHGAVAHASFALSGVQQTALSLSYLASGELGPRVLAQGRLGTSLLVSPEPNVGAEAGLGLVVKATARLALSLELVGNLYYGAATSEVGYPVYPIVSGQLGALVDWERLP
jgi:hypothetical protein